MEDYACDRTNRNKETNVREMKARAVRLNNQLNMKAH